MRSMQEALELYERSRQHIIEQAKAKSDDFAELTRGDTQYMYSDSDWARERPDEILIDDTEIIFRRWSQAGDSDFCIPIDYLLDPQGWTERHLEQRRQREKEEAENMRQQQEARREQEKQTLRRLLEKYPEER